MEVLAMWYNTKLYINRVNIKAAALYMEVASDS